MTNIIKKPWGREELLEINTNYVVKRLTMLKGKRCSLQYHRFRTETVYVLKGTLITYVGKSLKKHLLKPNDFITLEPGTIHRMEGLTKSVYLESSTPQLDDVVRLEDDYKRVINNKK